MRTYRLFIVETLPPQESAGKHWPHVPTICARHDRAAVRHARRVLAEEVRAARSFHPSNFPSGTVVTADLHDENDMTSPVATITHTVLSRSTPRQSLRRALRDPSIIRALHALDGCPFGSWAETDQAMRALRDSLPSKTGRTYTVCDLLDAALRVDNNDRWRFIMGAT